MGVLIGRCGCVFAGYCSGSVTERCGRDGRMLLKVCWQGVVGFERILLWVC